MNRTTLERLAPLTGIVFVALLLFVIFVVSNGEPDATDSTLSAATYWKAHDGREMIGALIAGVGVLFLVWFAGSLRATMRAAEGGEGRLSAIAFGGFLLFAVGGLLFAGIDFAAADTAGDVPPQVTQTLSVLNSDLFIPVSVGAGIAMLATGVATLRFGPLPKGMGWFAVVIGVVSMTPGGFFGFMGLLLWTLIASVLLYRAPPAAAAAS
jgi:hypothetical protein